MISREDFVFAIGYDGDTAVVDGRSKRKYSGYSTLELAEAGFFKPAICSALYEASEEALQRVLAIYNENSEIKLSSIEDLKRTFSTFEVPENISKTAIY